MKWYCDNDEVVFAENDPRLEERTSEGLPRCPICGKALEPLDDDDEEGEEAENDEQ